MPSILYTLYSILYTIYYIQKGYTRVLLRHHCEYSLNILYSLYSLDRLKIFHRSKIECKWNELILNQPNLGQTQSHFCLSPLFYIQAHLDQPRFLIANDQPLGFVFGGYDWLGVMTNLHLAYTNLVDGLH